MMMMMMMMIQQEEWGSKTESVHYRVSVKLQKKEEQNVFAETAG